MDLSPSSPSPSRSRRRSSLPFLPLQSVPEPKRTYLKSGGLDLDQERKQWKEQVFKVKLLSAQKFLDKIMEGKGVLPPPHTRYEGMEVSQFMDCLGDGVLLLDVIDQTSQHVEGCRSPPVNRVVRGTPLGKFCQAMENIHSFQQICRDLGMEEDEILSLNDLMEKRAQAVVDCILSLQSALHQKFGSLGGRLSTVGWDEEIRSNNQDSEVVPPPRNLAGRSAESSLTMSKLEMHLDSIRSDSPPPARQAHGRGASVSGAGGPEDTISGINNKEGAWTHEKNLSIASNVSMMSEEMRSFLEDEAQESTDKDSSIDEKQTPLLEITPPRHKSSSRRKSLEPKVSPIMALKEKVRNRSRQVSGWSDTSQAEAEAKNAKELAELKQIQNKFRKGLAKDLFAVQQLNSEHIKLKSDVQCNLAAFDHDIQQYSNSVAHALRSQLQRQVNLEERLARESAVRRRLFNQLQEIRGNIRVFCRVRPNSQDFKVQSGNQSPTSSHYGEEDAVWCKSEIDLYAKPPTKAANSSHRALRPKSFQFDRVFGPSSTQMEVFQEVAPLVTSVVDGYHACILAYGQTGSGKTYTMEGPEEDPGINSRALQELFHLKEDFEKGGLKTMRVEVSMLEIYNEQIRDLLVTSYSTPDLLHADKQQNLDIRQHSEGVFVEGLRQFEVEDLNTLRRVLRRGAASRAVGSTKCNEHSSRSHSVVMINVKVVENSTGHRSKGRLILVDLAGSERISRSGAEGQQLREATAINKSLSALGDVISALRQKQNRKDASAGVHIPYRNSKLTYLLQDSLGAENKALMIVQVSPDLPDLDESLCSLNFGSRVRCVELGQAKQHSDTSEQINRAKESALRSLKEEMSLKLSTVEQEKDNLIQELNDEMDKATLSLQDKTEEITRLKNENSAFQLKLVGVQQHGDQLAEENTMLRNELKRLLLKVAHQQDSTSGPVSTLTSGPVSALTSNAESPQALSSAQSDLESNAEPDDGVIFTHTKPQPSLIKTQQQQESVRSPTPIQMSPVITPTKSLKSQPTSPHSKDPHSSSPTNFAIKTQHRADPAIATAIQKDPHSSSPTNFAIKTKHRADPATATAMQKGKGSPNSSRSPLPNRKTSRNHPNSSRSPLPNQKIIGRRNSLPRPVLHKANSRGSPSSRNSSRTSSRNRATSSSNIATPYNSRNGSSDYSSLLEKKPVSRRGSTHGESFADTKQVKFHIRKSQEGLGKFNETFKINALDEDYDGNDESSIVSVRRSRSARVMRPRLGSGSDGAPRHSSSAKSRPNSTGRQRLGMPSRRLVESTPSRKPAARIPSKRAPFTSSHMGSQKRWH